MLEEQDISILLDIIHLSTTPLDEVYNRFITVFPDSKIFILSTCLSTLLRDNYLTESERIIAYYILCKLYPADENNMNPYIDLFIIDLENSPNVIEIDFLEDIIINNNIAKYDSITSSLLLSQYTNQQNKQIVRPSTETLRHSFDSFYPIPPALREKGVSNSFNTYLSITNNTIYQFQRPTDSLSSITLSGIITGNIMNWMGMEPELPDIQPPVFPMNKSQLFFTCPSLIPLSFECVPDPLVAPDFSTVITLLQNSLNRILTEEETNTLFTTTYDIKNYMDYIYTSSSVTSSFTLYSQSVNSLCASLLQKPIVETVFSPHVMKSLIYYNHNIAIWFLNYIFSNSIQTDDYLDAIVSIPISKKVMDVVYNLCLRFKFPKTFFKLFISNCIDFVNKTEDKKQQNKNAILLSIFLQSLIKNNIFDCKELSNEILSFCFFFSYLREVLLLLQQMN
ncbi:hypothetical protein WA158_000875 [Blastocystis sp. Blastoise]